MTGFETLAVEVDEGTGVGRLVLDRPAKLNALSPQVLVDLVDAARWFDDQPVRVVIVTGAGRAFSGGFDLDSFANPTLPPLEAGDLGRRAAEAITGMRALTIAAVRGRCVGGGVVLVAACDLRIAADDALFSIPEVDLGIPLAWGGIPRLVRELGPAITKELVLTCRPFDAEEARSLRFVNRVVPAEGLDAAADDLARSLAAKAPLVLELTKRHVNAATEELASTLGADRDAAVLVAAMADPGARAASRRYLEARRRSPSGGPVPSQGQ